MENLVTNKTKKSKKDRGTLIFILAMFAIPVVQHFVFFLYPNIESFFLAFKNKRVDGSEYFTLRNFIYIWDDLHKGTNSLMLQGLKNALIFWLFSNVFVFSLSYIWSYFLWKRIAGRSFFRVIFYLCSILGTATTASIFKFMIRDTGIVGMLYKQIKGLEVVPGLLMEDKYALKTILAFMFWTGFGGSYVLFGGAYAKIPDDLVEYSLIDGITNMWQEIWYLVLPLTWPTVSTLFLINLGTVFSASGPILLLTKGAGKTYTLSYWIFERIWTYSSYYQPSALGICMTLVTLPLYFFSRWLMRKVETVEY